MLKGEWGAESNGKLPHLFNPSKTEKTEAFTAGVMNFIEQSGLDGRGLSVC